MDLGLPTQCVLHSILTQCRERNKPAWITSCEGPSIYFRNNLRQGHYTAILARNKPRPVLLDYNICIIFQESYRRTYCIMTATHMDVFNGFLFFKIKLKWNKIIIKKRGNSFSMLFIARTDLQRIIFLCPFLKLIYLFIYSFICLFVCLFVHYLCGVIWNNR